MSAMIKKSSPLFAGRTISGSAADDYLEGTGGDDVINGLGGDDTLSSGWGNDSLSGGDGDDDLSPGGLADTVNGGSGLDTLRLYGMADAMTVDGSRLGEKATLHFTYGVSSVEATAMERLIVQGSSKADLLIGGRYNDRLQGNAGDDTLNGGGGDDVLGDTGGNSILLGGDGNDLLQLEGPVSGSLMGSFSLNGGTGTDQVLINNNGSTVALVATVMNGVIKVDSADDALRVRGTGVEMVSIYAGSAADTLTGGAGGDVLYGYDGLNKLSGGGGDDYLFGAGVLNGGAGDDHLIEYNGRNDTIDGGKGFDLYQRSIFVGSSQDTLLDYSSVIFGKGVTTIVNQYDTDKVTGVEGMDLRGDTGDDTILGSHGDDVIDGSFGSDTLRGGDGNDTIVLRQFIPTRGPWIADGEDVYDGGRGFDVADFAAAADGLTIDLAAGSAFSKASKLDTLISIEGAKGGRFSDTLSGNDAKNLLDGGVGDDLLNGRAGADTLIGGAGKDTLTGGSGADIFRFTADDLAVEGSRKDAIQDLALEDRIDLKGIDARVDLAGDQAFQIVSAFDGKAGVAVLSYSKGVTRLALHTDADGAADFIIQMDGDHRDFANYVL